MNCFFENIIKYTKNSFELIIIDNASTDGSGDFFEKSGAHVIRNKYNYSYPYSQNQGIEFSKGQWLAFLNNDIVVCPNWDEILINNASQNNLDVVTCCGIECIENKKETRKIRKKWSFIKKLLNFFGHNKKNLKRMHQWMYGDWENFCRLRKDQFKLQAIEGADSKVKCNTLYFNG